MILFSWIWGYTNYNWSEIECFIHLHLLLWIYVVTLLFLVCEVRALLCILRPKYVVSVDWKFCTGIFSIWGGGEWADMTLGIGTCLHPHATSIEWRNWECTSQRWLQKQHQHLFLQIFNTYYQSCSQRWNMAGILVFSCHPTAQ